MSGNLRVNLQVDLDIISDQRCMDTPNAGTFVPGQMFCAGHLTGGKEPVSIPPLKFDIPVIV